jgi:NAD(P)-dependent dehydrogenase (short-subunit alcohol dehydrogenase family)
MATSKHTSSAQRPLAVITGASTGIGYELAKCCAKENFGRRDRLRCDDEWRWRFKLQSAIANVVPSGVLAVLHRKMTAPGSGKKPGSAR